MIQYSQYFGNCSAFSGNFRPELPYVVTRAKRSSTRFRVFLLHVCVFPVVVVEEEGVRVSSLSSCAVDRLIKQKQPNKVNNFQFKLGVNIIELEKL